MQHRQECDRSRRIVPSKVNPAEKTQVRPLWARFCIRFTGSGFSLHGANVAKLSRSWGVYTYAKLVSRTKKASRFAR